MDARSPATAASLPLVSIGMPVYNGARLLRETVESLLNQSYPNFELIISDNASTDDTLAMAREFEALDARVRVSVNTSNVGAAENYNRLVGMARGPLFKWAACDDLMAPDFIERCVDALQSDADAVLAYTDTTIIDAQSNRVTDYVDKLVATSASPLERWWACNLSIGECNAVFGIVRTDVLRRTALIGKFIGSDRNLLVEISLHGRFVCIPERLFLRRDHPDASSSDRSTKAQLKFYDPRLTGVVLSQFRGLRQDVRAVLRAPISAGDKLRVLLGILRRGFWHRQRLWRELTGQD